MGLQIRTGLKSNHRIRGGSGLFAARPQMPDRGSAFDCDECRPFAFLQKQKGGRPIWVCPPVVELSGWRLARAFAQHPGKAEHRHCSQSRGRLGDAPHRLAARPPVVARFRTCLSQAEQTQTQNRRQY